MENNNSLEERIIDLEIKLLIQAIGEFYGYDFKDYAYASFKRRISHYILKNNYKSVCHCIDDLLNNETHFYKFISEISIHVTEMFRNPDFFISLRDKIIPLLSSYPYLNIWSAGCATGEEVYSLAIVLHEAALLERSRIFATDICRNSVEIAKQAIYPTELLRAYIQNYQQFNGREIFSNYYIVNHNHVMIADFLSRNILYNVHNLSCDAVFNQMHLILCRKVLIYFNQTLQTKVIKLFSSSLIPRGFLCLGDKENIKYISRKNQFQAVCEKHKIFRVN